MAPPTKPLMRRHHLFRYFATLLSAVTTIFLASSPAIAQGATSVPPQNPDTSQWIQPHAPGDPLIWGRRDGIVFGLPSPGGLRGPRGLIRVGIISPTTGKPELLNFIAVEPVILGPGSRSSRMAFSELEPSRLDLDEHGVGEHGKRLSVDLSSYDKANLPTGTVQTFPGERNSPAIERLSVQIDVERFSANGAHVHLIASIDSDHPEIGRAN